MVEYISQEAFYIKYTAQLVCLEKTGHKTNDLLKQKPKLQIKSFTMQKQTCLKCKRCSKRFMQKISTTSLQCTHWLKLLSVKSEQEQCTLQINGRSKQEKYLPCILRVLFAVKTIKNKFSRVLCLTQLSQMCLITCGNMSRKYVRKCACPWLDADRRYPGRKYIRIHARPIGIDRKYSALTGVPL